MLLFAYFPCIRTGRRAVSAVQPEWQCPFSAFARLVPPHSVPSLRLFALTSLHSSFWPPQGHNAAYGHRGRPHNWESDSESEMSDYGSLPRFKRQVSEHGSECGAEQQPARPRHPPALPARTHAGRPRARAPAPAIVLNKAPRACRASRSSAHLPPPPRLPPALPISTASSDALLPPSPCAPLHPVAPSACTPSHRLAPPEPLLQVRPTTCRASSVTTRRARRHSGPGAPRPKAARGRGPRGSAVRTR